MADALGMVRHDWMSDEVQELYHRPLLDLVFEAQRVHRTRNDPTKVQRCTLLSVKTGGCPEDCAYCPQSARYSTGIDNEKMMEVDEVLEAADKAREAGATRFCMGAAWRSAKRGPQFDKILEMVRGVADRGMEVCCTLGMLSADQAQQLQEAGLTAYNHNLDTSEGFYDEIISTRSYRDRLETLQHVRDAGVNVCCGGIVGMGESARDRCEMLRVLASFDPQPESVPINQLVKVEGTPLADQEDVDPFEVVRTVATARILMPDSRVRLAAGRKGLTREAQALCFMAGANSIFFGEQLLTTPNPGEDEDTKLLRDLGMAVG